MCVGVKGWHEGRKVKRDGSMDATCVHMRVGFCLRAGEQAQHNFFGLIVRQTFSDPKALLHMFSCDTQLGTRCARL